MTLGLFILHMVDLKNYIFPSGMKPIVFRLSASL